MTTVYELLETLNGLPDIPDPDDRTEVYGKVLVTLNALAPHILNLWSAVQRLQEADQEMGPDNYPYQDLVHTANDLLNTKAMELYSPHNSRESS